MCWVSNTGVLPKPFKNVFFFFLMIKIFVSRASRLPFLKPNLVLIYSGPKSRKIVVINKIEAHNKCIITLRAEATFSRYELMCEKLLFAHQLIPRKCSLCSQGNVSCYRLNFPNDSWDNFTINFKFSSVPFISFSWHSFSCVSTE